MSNYLDKTGCENDNPEPHEVEKPDAWRILDCWLASRCHVCGAESREACRREIHSFWSKKLTRKRYSL